MLLRQFLHLKILPSQKHLREIFGKEIILKGLIGKDLGKDLTRT